jgi:hypothetical protein
MKKLRVEDLLIDPLERWIRITTGGVGTCQPFLRIVVGQQPFRGGEYLRDITQDRLGSFSRK